MQEEQQLLMQQSQGHEQKRAKRKQMELLQNRLSLTEAKLAKLANVSEAAMSSLEADMEQQVRE